MKKGVVPLSMLDRTGGRLSLTGKESPRTKLGFVSTHGFMFWTRSWCLFNSRSRSRFINKLSVINLRRVISTSCAAAAPRTPSGMIIDSPRHSANKFEFTKRLKETKDSCFENDHFDWSCCGNNSGSCPFFWSSPESVKSITWIGQFFFKYLDKWNSQHHLLKTLNRTRGPI